MNNKKKNILYFILIYNLFSISLNIKIYINIELTAVLLLFYIYKK